MRPNSNYQRMQNCDEGRSAREMNMGSTRNRGMNYYNRRNQNMDYDYKEDNSTGCHHMSEQSDCTCMHESKPMECCGEKPMERCGEKPMGRCGEKSMDRCGEGRKSMFSYSDIHLGMAYVPMQRWENMFEVEKGFPHGSIFKDLIFPYKSTNCPAGRRGM